VETPELRIEVREVDNYRWLLFGDGVVQSAMALDEPARLVLPYTFSLLAPLLFRPEPGQTGVMGVGAGSLIRFFDVMLPSCTVRACDASEPVVDVARQFFGLPPAGSRFELQVLDARTAIAGWRELDLLFVDIFDEAGMPGWVGSEPFLCQCRQALGTGGVVAINLMPESDSALAEFLATLRHAFSGRVLLGTLPQYRNVIALAFESAPGELSVRNLGIRAKRLDKRFRVPFSRVFQNLCRVNRCHRGQLII